MRSILTAALLFGCSGRAAPEPPSEPAMVAAPDTRPSVPARAPGLAAPADAALAPAVAASNRLGVDLHRALAGANPSENVFFSPASVSVALTMTSAGAAGTTLDAMRATLHLPDEGAHEAFGTLLQSWNRPDQAHELAVANRVWVQQGFELQAPFTAILTAHYKAGLGRTDFAEPGANGLINRWVEAQTRDRIRDLIPDGVLDRDTRVVLTNAVYFKGTWKTAFDPALTAPRPFTLRGGETVDVPMMQRTGPMALFRDAGFSLVALPYEGDGVELVAVVPHAPDGLDEIERGLTAERLDGWLATARPSPVILSFPRLKLETSATLDAPMAKLGMGIAMTDAADFSAMSTKEPLKIDAILHKAFLELDEQGTEAAAATAVVVATRSAASAPEPPTVVDADRPFLLGIRDQHTGAWLFLGRIVDPR